MQVKDLKRKWGIELGVLVTSVVIVFALVYYLSDVHDDYEKQSKEVDAQVAKVMIEKNALSAKFDKVTKNLSLYEEAVARNPLDGNYAARQKAQDTFNIFKTRYNLNDLRLTLNPPVNLIDNRFKRNTSVVGNSDVIISFNSVLDDNAYNLMQAMQDELLGIIKIVSLKLVCKEHLSDKALQDILEKGTTSLVTADMRAAWLGIRPVATKNPLDPNAKAKP